MVIVDGRKIAAEILKKIARRKTAKKAALSVFLAGSNPASISFIKQKERAAHTAHIEFTLHQLPSSVSTKRLVLLIKKAAKTSTVIVQLPLPERIKHQQAILNAIPKNKDADFLSEEHLASVSYRSHILPPIVSAAKKVMKKYRISPRGKNIVLFGMGRLIGLPMFLWLLDSGAHIFCCDARTKNKFSVLKKADIVISGIGKAGVIRGAHIKKNAVCIDFGFSKTTSGKISGDFDFASCTKKARLVTPVPGGMGPIAVACLMENVSIFGHGE